MHALRVAVGIGGLRLESIFERVAHQPALAGGMCALHTKFVRFLIKTSNTLLYDYSTVSMTPPPSQDGSSSGDDPEHHGPAAETTADSADIAALLSSSTSTSVGMTMATLAVAASVGNDARTDENTGDRESGAPTDT